MTDPLLELLDGGSTVTIAPGSAEHERLRSALDAATGFQQQLAQTMAMYAGCGKRRRELERLVGRLKADLTRAQDRAFALRHENNKLRRRMERAEAEAARECDPDEPLPCGFCHPKDYDSRCPEHGDRETTQ